MSEALVTVERAEAVWNVTLSRPQQGNALSAALVSQLDATMQDAERDGAVAIVLQGAGRHFCTGFDLSALDAETGDSLLARFVRIELMLQRVARAPFLTVAVGHGRVTGAGADLFAACDVRLVRNEATFAFPGARGFGLVLGTRRLGAIVGRDTALEWVEPGRAIGADEATKAGLATAVIATDEQVQQACRSRLAGDPAVARSLRLAASPHHDIEDAFDLKRLVDSAARAGLRDRIAAYVERSAARSARREPT